MFLSGFEPLAFRLGGGRSILLSYRNISYKYTTRIIRHTPYGPLSIVSYFSKKIKSKFHRALHPNLALEPAARQGFAQQILLVDGHVKLHVVAVQLQIIDLLAGHAVGLDLHVRDLADHRVLVAFHAAGHEAGIDDGVDVLVCNPPGHHGVQVNVLDGQRLDGVLVPVLRRLDEPRPLP